MGRRAESRVWEGKDLDQAGRACPSRPCAADVAAPGTLGCRCVPVGVIRTRPRRALVPRRRFAYHVRLSLATARRHETLGRQARWVAEGSLFPPPPEGDAAPACPQDGAVLHCHEKHRIMVVVDGSGALHTQDGPCTLRPGDIVVLGPGQAHRLSRGSAPLNLLTLEFFPGALLTAAEQPLVVRVFGGRPVIRCASAAAAEAQSLMHRLRAEQHRDKAASVVAVRACLMSLLVLLYRRSRGAGDAGLGAPEPLLREVQAYMQANFHAPLRVRDLAAQTHLSVRQFTARFKRACGETPLRYLTRLRVAAAQELLCSSTKGVAEIARAVGYENLSHFYRTFALHAGTSPGRYRTRPTEVPRPVL